MKELSQEMNEQIARDMAKSQFVDVLLPMFERAWQTGITEFRLVLRGEPDKPTNFYIHPSGRDGETIDINWEPLKIIEESTEE